MGYKSIISAVASMAIAVGMAGIAVMPAQGSEQEYSTVVSSTPASTTPHVLDGIVFSVAEVGDMIVLGGSFTQVQAASGGAVRARIAESENQDVKRAVRTVREEEGERQLPASIMSLSSSCN